MSMTVFTTRNAPDRILGFLRSVAHEADVGIFVAPYMNKAVRLRVWEVVAEWAAATGPETSVVMLWNDPATEAKFGICTTGTQRRDVIDHDGYFLVKR